jgi:uncharacterized membrane protein
MVGILQNVADSWSSMYSNSPAIKSALSFAHIGGLVGGGGCAIAADRATLKALRRPMSDMAHRLEELRGVHRVVIAGLVIVTVSGLLLALADLDSYLQNTLFWIKMAFVVALLANGGLVMHAGTRVHGGDESARGALKFACVASVTLWFTTTLLGATLPNVL